MTLFKISNLTFKLLCTLGCSRRIVGGTTNLICLCLRLLVLELESLKTRPELLTFAIAIGKLLLKSKLLFLQIKTIILFHVVLLLKYEQVLGLLIREIKVHSDRK